MKYNRLNKLFKSFAENQSGETAVQTTLVFSAAVVVGVLVTVPMLNNASKDYAYNKNYGIDTVVTSSIDSKKSSKTKRYIVRKSIFDAVEENQAPAGLPQ